MASPLHTTTWFKSCNIDCSANKGSPRERLATIVLECDNGKDPYVQRKFALSLSLSLSLSRCSSLMSYLVLKSYNAVRKGKETTNEV